MKIGEESDSGVSLVRTGERFALYGEEPEAWIQASPGDFVELEE